MHFSDYTTVSIEKIYTSLGTCPEGLTESQVVRIRTDYGANILSVREVHWIQILIRQFRSPFLYLLLFAAGIAFALGEIFDAGMILLFVGVNAGLGFFQEFRSEQAVRLLRSFVVSHCKVKRHGQDMQVATADVVPGDIVQLVPGDIVPADLRFVETKALSIDESILTGESATVYKISDTLIAKEREIYKALNIGFSGTTVVSGQGIGVVIGTGAHTVMGEIAALTVETRHESSFEKDVGRFSAFILRVILVTLVLLFATNILVKGHEVHIGNLVVFIIALAVSVVPEALPVVTTFSLSRGALKLAKKKVVLKRLSAIEDLGSIEVLCTDKTGTITENKLSVVSISPGAHEETILFGGFASGDIDTRNHIREDSFDRAIHNALSDRDREKMRRVVKIHEQAFDPQRKRNNVVIFRSGKYELIVRGAAEAVLPLCHHIEISTKKVIQEWITLTGKQGKRVLAIASRTLTKKEALDPGNKETPLTLVGLIAFSDPLKHSTAHAVKKARMLGISIKILTGDSKDVAGAVAFETGLSKSVDDVITGDELEQLPLEQQEQAVGEYNVFARVTPAQKHRIVELLKKRFEVGFLGEGINDAPALKAANVALVVDHASDVAREASDIVLTNKSLDVIIDGIMTGREIFANTAKYIKATIASNFGNFYTVAIASLLVDFLPMLPLQILLVNMLTDSPMIAVSTDSVETEELMRPKSYDIREIAQLTTILGVVSTVFDFIFFVLYFRTTPATLQTYWFIGSVLTELVFLFSLRTKGAWWKATRPSTTLLALSALAFIVAIGLPFTPMGQRVFSFITPDPKQLMLIIGITIVYFFCTDIVKQFSYKYVGSKNVLK